MLKRTLDYHQPTKFLTCDPKVLSLDCSLLANASARPRHDILGMGRKVVTPHCSVDVLVVSGSLEPFMGNFGVRPHLKGKRKFNL